MQTGICHKRLKKFIELFRENKLSFEEINELSDEDLAELFTITEEPINKRTESVLKYLQALDRDIKTQKKPIKTLWEDYLIKHPDGLGLSHFKRHIASWRSRIQPSMRFEHKAGDKMYIDFAGEKLVLKCKETNLTKPVEVFVSILGASQLTYIEAVMTQQKEDFIPACENALYFYNGVPAAIVTDNLRSAVTKSSKYEPTINETFNNFAEHYNTTILPARIYKPKDKALVESAIKIIYSRVYPEINSKTFNSLVELNKAIALILESYNNQILTGKDYSRRQKFEELERSALVPLPLLRYEFKRQLFATVAKHGHVALAEDKHFYSVPYKYIGKKIKILYSRYVVEMFYNYERIAIHKRLRAPYKYTTDNEHLNPSHRFISELNSDKLILLATEIHNDVRKYVISILSQDQHPEKLYRLCLGVLSFAKKVGNERLTRACQRATEFGCFDYKIIKNILERRMDNLIDEEENIKMPVHDNIRGKDYYN